MKAKSLAAAMLASLDEVIAVVIIIFWLPYLGVEVPPLYAFTILVGLAIFSYLLYRVIKPVVVKPPLVGAEAMVGLTGETLTKLSPKGLVVVGGEKWRAVALEGLTLKVKRCQPEPSGIL